MESPHTEAREVAIDAAWNVWCESASMKRAAVAAIDKMDEHYHRVMESNGHFLAQVLNLTSDLTKAQATIERMTSTFEEVLKELGIPYSETPMPVANAVDLVNGILAEIDHD